MCLFWWFIVSNSWPDFFIVKLITHRTPPLLVRKSIKYYPIRLNGNLRWATAVRRFGSDDSSWLFVAIIWWWRILKNNIDATTVAIKDIARSFKLSPRCWQLMIVSRGECSSATCWRDSESREPWIRWSQSTLRRWLGSALLERSRRWRPSSNPSRTLDVHWW